jgi:CRP-like cAMP-binding protein
LAVTVLPSASVDPASLRTVPLFATCSDDDMAHLVGLVCRLRFPMGTRLGTQGQPDAAFVLVVEGRADVVRDGEVIGRLGPGEHHGARALVLPSPAPATVVATGDVLVDRISAAQFRHLVVTTPSLAWPLIEALAGLSAHHAAWR